MRRAPAMHENVYAYLVKKQTDERDVSEASILRVVVIDLINKIRIQLELRLRWGDSNKIAA